MDNESLTWRKLRDRINLLAENELDLPVIFREPYDDGAESYPVNVWVATGNLENDDGEVVIQRGQAFLGV